MTTAAVDFPAKSIDTLEGRRETPKKSREIDMSRKIKPFLPLVAAALLAASAGWHDARAQTAEAIAKLAGPDRARILLDGARKEGEVSFYTTLIAEAMRPLQDDWAKRYPFIKLSSVRSGSSEILQRVLAEQRARSIRVDVIDGDAPEIFKESGIALAIATPIMAEYPADYIDPDRTWIANRNSWQGIAWNTKMVGDAEAPRTWEALADPKWKGKLVWAESSGTGAPRVITHVRKLWGEDKAMAYLNRLKDQGVRTLPGSVRTVLDQIIAGEYPVGIGMSMHHIADSMVKGAPIHGSSPDPALARAQSLHYVRGAPHPHAGMVFFEYFLSRDGGQQALREAKYNPAHPGVEPLPELRWFQPNLNGMKELIVPPEEVEAMRKSSSDLYKTLFR